MDFNWMSETSHSWRHHSRCCSWSDLQKTNEFTQISLLITTSLHYTWESEKVVHLVPFKQFSGMTLCMITYSGSPTQSLTFKSVGEPDYSHHLLLENAPGGWVRRGLSLERLPLARESFRKTLSLIIWCPLIWRGWVRWYSLMAALILFDTDPYEGQPGQ